MHKKTIYYWLNTGIGHAEKLWISIVGDAQDVIGCNAGQPAVVDPA